MERQAPIKRRRESESAENMGAGPSAEVAVRTGAEEESQSLQDQGLLYHIPHPGSRLFEALNSGFLTDATILVGDEAIKCHSNVVSCASPKLAAILKENEPRLPDVDPRHFRLLLQIIYTGKILKISQNRDTLWDTFLHVGRLAHELQVYTAVDACAESLAMNKLDTENFWTILDFAILIDDVKLKHHCLDTSCIKAGILLGRKGYLNHKVSRLELILKQDTLFNVTELQLFQACVAWANANVDESENRRDALDLALRLIRFRLISAEDFAEHVCPTGLLRTEEERDILRSLVTGKNLMPEGFSVSTSPRDLGRIMENKLPSTGERKSMNEFPQGLQTSFIIYATKKTFILGVKLQAWRSNLSEGFVFDENVLISLQDKLSGKILPLQEAGFCGQVNNGDTITIKFQSPLQMIAYNHYTLHVGYSTESAANPTYQLYLPEIISQDESGMLIRNLRETLAPPDLHIIVGEKVATAI